MNKRMQLHEMYENSLLEKFPSSGSSRGDEVMDFHIDVASFSAFTCGLVTRVINNTPFEQYKFHSPEKLVHRLKDLQQRGIMNDEACVKYLAHLTRLEEMIELAQSILDEE